MVDPADSERKWFYAIHGKRRGPVSAHELVRLYELREVALVHLVWREGLPDWVSLLESGLLESSTPAEPPPLPPLPTEAIGGIDDQKPPSAELPAPANADEAPTSLIKRAPRRSRRRSTTDASTAESIEAQKTPRFTGKFLLWTGGFWIASILIGHFGLKWKETQYADEHTGALIVLCVVMVAVLSGAVITGFVFLGKLLSMFFGGFGNGHGDGNYTNRPIRGNEPPVERPVGRQRGGGISWCAMFCLTIGILSLIFGNGKSVGQDN
jgi:hypothetical protein